MPLCRGGGASKQEGKSIALEQNFPGGGKDSDGDGVEDWEEGLRNTDPHNPDSDGDGTLDGEEKHVEGTTKNFLDTSLVNRVSPTGVLLDSFAGYIGAHVVPGEEYEIEFDDKLGEAFAEGSARELEKLNTLRNPYSPENIKLDDSKSSKEYLNEIAQITQKHFPDNPGDDGYRNELTGIYEFLFAYAENSSEMTHDDLSTSLREIEKYKNRYEAAAKELAEIGVPAKAVPIHVDIVNSLANTALSLEEIMAYSRDPIIGFHGMHTYGIEAEKSRNIFVKIKEFIQKERVVFETTDPGYEFQKSYVDKAS